MSILNPKTHFQTAAIKESRSFERNIHDESYDSMELLTDEELATNDEKLKYIPVNNFN
jgi:hypothetical protein